MALNVSFHKRPGDAFIVPTGARNCLDAFIRRCLFIFTVIDILLLASQPCHVDQRTTHPLAGNQVLVEVAYTTTRSASLSSSRRLKAASSTSGVPGRLSLHSEITFSATQAGLSKCAFLYLSFHRSFYSYSFYNKTSLWAGDRKPNSRLHRHRYLLDHRSSHPTHNVYSQYGLTQTYISLAKPTAATWRAH